MISFPSSQNFLLSRGRLRLLMQFFLGLLVDEMDVKGKQMKHSWIKGDMTMIILGHKMDFWPDWLNPMIPRRLR